MSEPYDWDLFISYASEDRDSVVRPLVDALRQFGLNPWWDEFELKVGDSLSRSIDKGLARSQFGVVVISHAFLEKRWAEYELRGLTAREFNGSKVVLPAWYGIRVEDVLRYSPPLADKKAVIIGFPPDSDSLIDTAMSILEVVNPDLLTKLTRRVAWEARRKNAIQVSVPLSQVKAGGKRHAELPDHLISRIRLIRAALLSVYPQNMEFWLDGFSGDAHPSREIAVWERIASAYLEVLQFGLIAGEDQQQEVFNFFLSMSMSSDEPFELAPELDEHRDLFVATFSQSRPVIEVEDSEPFPFGEEQDVGGIDIEDFADRLSPELAERLIERAAGSAQGE
ncbi:toll/interleukin-1 receptor domain-containing protein [Microbacterium sp. NPDC058345]|uniref:toll/interleukin-1 receptor domain-containing protein n=1 Tax=Microbacterium sp. NPDC058345 TaxID=3346455 RepID=UPI00364F1C52